MDKKQSIKQFVYSSLKEAILSRKLSPGKQLIETGISQNLNVSRTPVRNAIELLASEGLVEIVPNKGAYVINPTLEEILQAYSLRKDLEIMAANQSMGFLKDTDFAEMESIITMEDKALQNKDLKSYLEANQNFHIAITKRCGNKFLIDFIKKLINQTSIYLILFDVFFEKTSSKPYGYIEHMEIIQLLKQKKRTELEKCLTKHFDNAVDSLDVQTEYQDLGHIFK